MYLWELNDLWAIFFVYAPHSARVWGYLLQKCRMMGGPNFWICSLFFLGVRKKIGQGSFTFLKQT